MLIYFNNKKYREEFMTPTLLLGRPRISTNQSSSHLLDMGNDACSDLKISLQINNNIFPHISSFLILKLISYFGGQILLQFLYMLKPLQQMISVSSATRLRAGLRTNRGSLPSTEKRFSLLCRVQTVPKRVKRPGCKLTAFLHLMLKLRMHTLTYVIMV